MFDFFFKRGQRQPLPRPDDTPEGTPDQAAALARQQAMDRADALAGADETAVVDFLVQCPFAEARLKAAAHLHSRSALERVAQALRNTDRRVVKLMQQRLDHLEKTEQGRQKAQACIAQARQLADSTHLTPSQVADLDRTWQQAEPVEPSLQETFERTRAVLAARLQDQAGLQRAALDTRSQLQRVVETLGDPAYAVQAFEIGRTLGILERAIEQHRTAPEAASLPRQLLADSEEQLQAARRMLAEREQRRLAAAAREEALARWEALPAAELRHDDMRAEWHSLPTPDAQEAPAFEDRFRALLERGAPRPAPPAPQAGPDRQDVKELRRKFEEALAGLERALENGGLQEAAECDKILRAIDPKVLRDAGPLEGRLARARAELHRLQDWAKWGGNVSREELLKAAEELPAQAHAPAELARKVGSLRERWKSLDVSAGAAPKALWERFDAACGAAYAPAAEHFRKMAEERLQNLERARAMIAETRRYALDSGCGGNDGAAVDWKAVAAHCMRSEQAWQRIGTIPRKEKKALDAEFRAAMQLLQEPLAAQRALETGRREQLIAEARALDPADRGAPDALRALQERWQERARAMPLERHQEQALWQHFRGACDALFSGRKTAARAADAERRQNQLRKETLCASLEAALAQSERPETVVKLLRDAGQEWDKAGPVPRAIESTLEARYRAARGALQTGLERARRAASQAQARGLCGKLALCQETERACIDRVLAGTPPDAAAVARWKERWSALPSLAPDDEKTVRKRFEAALSALETGDRGYGAILEHNRPLLMQELLRMEILLRIDSPAELARERLQLQVEVLQASLKSAQGELPQAARLQRLCGLAALTEPRTAERIERVAMAVLG